MPTRSGREYHPQIQHSEHVQLPLPNSLIHAHQTGKGGLWGYNDHDYCHRHRPEDPSPKSIYVPAHYRREPA